MKAVLWVDGIQIITNKRQSELFGRNSGHNYGIVGNGRPLSYMSTSDVLSCHGYVSDTEERVVQLTLHFDC